MSDRILLSSVDIFTNPRGEHNLELTYAEMDEVQHHTSLYVASEAIPVGVAITDPRWVCKLDNSASYAAEQLRTTAETGRNTAEGTRQTLHTKWSNPSAEATQLDSSDLPTASAEVGETGVKFTLGIPKGNTGDPGVAVSDTEPTDLNVGVWLNPSGTEYTMPASAIGTDVPGESVQDRLNTNATQLAAIDSQLYEPRSENGAYVQIDTDVGRTISVQGTGDATAVKLRHTGANLFKYADLVKTADSRGTTYTSYSYADHVFQCVATLTYSYLIFSMPVIPNVEQTIAFSASRTESAFGQIALGDSPTDIDEHVYSSVNIIPGATNYKYTFTPTSSMIYFKVYITSSGSSGTVNIEDITLGIGADITVSDWTEPQSETLDYETEAFEASTTAYEGVNILYTSTGSEITATAIGDAIIPIIPIIRADIEQLQAGIVQTPWTAKKGVAYGDSITGGNSSLYTHDWLYHVRTRLGLTELRNQGLGGARVSAYTAYALLNADGTTYQQDFTHGSAIPDGKIEVDKAFCADSRLALVPDDADLIIIMGGTNDWTSNIALGDMTYSSGYNEATYKGALADTIRKLQVRAPGASLVIATPYSAKAYAEDGAANVDYFAVNSLGLTIGDYADAAIEVARALAIPVIDVYGNAGVNIHNRASYMYDSTHPYTDAGEWTLARVMIPALLGIYPLIQD